MIPLADSHHADMSSEAVDQRLRDLAQIYKLGMSLKGAQWLGPINGQSPSSVSALPVAARDEVADRHGSNA